MLKTHMTACLVATMLAAPALAQTSPAPVTAPASPSSTMPSSMPGKFLSKIEPTQFMASKLIGTKVISADNEAIGDLNDVIVDRNGQAIAAVVGVGGFLGIGEKNVAIPFNMLEFATREQISAMTGKGVTTTGSTVARVEEPDRVILRMTKAELQAAPKFDISRDVTTGSTGATPPVAPKP